MVHCSLSIFLKTSHEIVFHVPRFIDDHGAVGLFSEKKREYLHDLIKLEAAQLSYVRNDFERLRPIMEQDEQWAQVDPSLCTPSRGVKVVKTIFRPVIFSSYFFISFVHGALQGQHYLLLLVYFIRLEGCWCLLCGWDIVEWVEKNSKVPYFFLFFFFIFWFGFSYSFFLSLVPRK